VLQEVNSIVSNHSFANGISCHCANVLQMSKGDDHFTNEYKRLKRHVIFSLAHHASFHPNSSSTQSIASFLFLQAR
jgi:hypothetical protein